jgi:CubicO group peptidase (beta-lactamase class C family)
MHRAIGALRYNENHLQLAGALAVAATGLDVKALAAKYLFEPYGMTDSFYDGQCPGFADGLVTTGDDYEKFMHGVLTYAPLSKEIVDASEENYTPFNDDGYQLYGAASYFTTF